jgi:hypothetical protein
MKKRGKKMAVAIGILLILIGIVTVYFNIPYSPVKHRFYQQTDDLIVKDQINASSDVFTEEDSDLPIAI